MCEILIAAENANNLGKAFQLFSEVLEVVKQDKDLYRSIEKHICQLYMRAGDYEEALPHALQSVKLCEGEYGKHHVKTAEAYIQAADCYGELASVYAGSTFVQGNMRRPFIMQIRHCRIAG